MELAVLKKRYSELQKKYKLVPFFRLNKDFEIDKIDKETESLARAIRKLMIDKIVNSMNFLEMLLNQINAPRLYLPFLKISTAEDRKLMDELYSKMGALSILSLELEINSSEKKEVEAIRKISDAWTLLKPGFMKIVEKIKNPDAFLTAVKKEKSYFG